MITLKDYWMGRDKQFPADFTPEVRANGAITVDLVNALLAEAEADGVVPGVDSVTKSAVGSGWRPPAVNAGVANAAKKSTHQTADACDVRDNKDRGFARWCLRNLAVLERIGLWMEDPQWTPTWVHLQRKPPVSGRRVYPPSTAKPLAPPLPEQKK